MFLRDFSRLYVCMSLTHCCIGRWQPPILVARPAWGETELLGRLPAWDSAVLLQPGREVHGYELLLQL